MLLTRTPLNALLRPLDLHVLGTPPTFVLSQDQTRQLIWPDFLRSRCAVGFATAYFFFHPARTSSERGSEGCFCFLLPDDSSLPGIRRHSSLQFSKNPALVTRVTQTPPPCCQHPSQGPAVGVGAAVYGHPTRTVNNFVPSSCTFRHHLSGERHDDDAFHPIFNHLNLLLSSPATDTSHHSPRLSTHEPHATSPSTIWLSQRAPAATPAQICHAFESSFEESSTAVAVAAPLAASAGRSFA